MIFYKIHNIIYNIKNRNKNNKAYKEQLVIYIKQILEHGVNS